MIVRIAVLVFALLVAHQLQRAVGDHFVRVHVGRRPGAALEDVEPELVVQLPVDEFLAGALHAGEDLLAELPAVEVGARRGHLHHREGLDQVRIELQLNPGDVEVLERAGGLHAVVGVGGHGFVAQQIVLEAGGSIRHGVLIRKHGLSDGSTRVGCKTNTAIA